MSYSQRLTIPADTAESDPESVIIPVSTCVINRVELTFPSGCVGLVGVWFEYLDHQIWPTNTGGRYRGNGQTIRINPNFEIKEPPFEITMYGFNEDDTYQHIIYVVLDVEFPGGILEQLFGRFWGT